MKSQKTKLKNQRNTRVKSPRKVMKNRRKMKKLLKKKDEDKTQANEDSTKGKKVEIDVKRRHK